MMATQLSNWSQDSLKELVEQKEEEWKQVQHLRSETLEAALNEKEKLYLEQKAQFQKLKEDFKFNLHLLGERDAALNKYDSVYSELKVKLAERENELSDLKIRLDEAKSGLSQENRLRDELQAHYQQRIREKQNEMDKYRCGKDAEIQMERGELESFKRNLQRQVRELEEELEIQKRELNAGFEEAMRKREHEFRLQADEMSQAMLAHEMKEKLSSKELELMKASQVNTQVECQQAEGSHRELEKQLKHKTWELEDLRAMKEARISELGAKLKSAEEQARKQLHDFNRKCGELDRAVQDKEGVIQRLRQSTQDRDSQQEDQLRSSQAVIEELQIKLQQANWTAQDLTKEKEAAAESLMVELSDVKSRWDKHVSDISRDQAHKDVEYEIFKEDNCKLKAELIQRKEDVDRYKGELAAAVERESTLEQRKTQLDLDWQRRWESQERQQYEKAEDLIKSLTDSRNQAFAEVKDQNRELSHTEDLIKLLTKERDQALSMLRKHGLVSESRMELSREEPVKDTADLEKQNINLRQVIGQMRQEMESLGQTSQPHGSVANEYVRNLEEEMSSLKVKCCSLQQQVADGSEGLKVTKEEHNRALEAAGDNSYVKAHMEQLNSTIGSLRGEKVELMATLRKQQTRLQHIEKALDQAIKQPRAKQVQVDQLQYEVNALSRRYEAEQSSLKARISELELLLAETHKEADEYHKANLERNMEVTALETKLSQMKMEKAENSPVINFGAQELLIQQLQDEVRHLRKLQKGEESINGILTFGPDVGQGQGLSTNAMVAQLQQKLKTAAKHITQLAREKQQLIEMGNRLRAELKNRGLQPSALARSEEKSQQKPLHSSCSSVLQQQIANKLQHLEQLQYKLTKQELAHSPRRPAVPAVVTLEPSSTEEEEDYKRLQSILKQPPARPSTAPRLHSQADPVLPQPHPQAAVTSRIPAMSQSDNLPTQWTSSPARDHLPAGVMASMSSVGGESLQEVWRMMEEAGESPRPFTPKTTTDSNHGSTGPFAGLQFPGESRSYTSDGDLLLKGQPSVVEQRPQSQTRKMSHKVLGKSGAIKGRQKPKIRNWNVKDDNTVK